MKSILSIPVKRIFRIFLFIALCLCICYGIFVGIVKMFQVTDIEVMADWMQFEVNQKRFVTNILFFPSDTIRSEMLDQYPQLKDVEIRKKYPHTIQIFPVLRTPIAVLVTSKGNYAIDEAGTVIQPVSETTQYPTITIDVDTIRVGGTIKEESIVGALSFLTLSKDIGVVQNITTFDSESIIAKMDTMNIIIPQNNVSKTLVGTLQAIVTGFRIKGTVPKRIDLRYTKPVIE